MVTVVLTGLKTSYYSRKTGRVVVNLHDQFASIGGLARCRSTTRLPLRLFLLTKLPLGRAEQPFPFLFDLVCGSAGYTNVTFSVMAFHVSFLLLFVTLSVNLLCKMPLFASTFSAIIVNSLVVKLGFLFLFSPLFPVFSSRSMFTQLRKNFALHSFQSALKTTVIPRALHSISRQNLFVMWESPLLDNLFLE